MSETSDWNAHIIEQFRSNGGQVGPPFEGAPLTLLHHRGRRTGRDLVNPMMYMPGEDPGTIYVFASNAGRAEHPQWYLNVVEAGSAEAEVGTQTWPVAVREVTGTERDRIYSEQASRYPGFAEYEEKTAGIRTIPVLELRRT